MMRDWGLKLRIRLLRFQLTQRALAQKVAVSQEHLSRTLGAGSVLRRDL
jgi:hypothetical protein